MYSPFVLILICVCLSASFATIEHPVCLLFGIITCCLIGWSILYLCDDFTYLNKEKTLQCYWIDGQPYYKNGLIITHMSHLFNDNVPTDTKMVKITYKDIEQSYHYGIIPLSESYDKKVDFIK